MRLHGGAAPGQKLHADTRSGFENFSLSGANETGIFYRGLKQGKDIGAIEARDAAKSRDGRTHLAALESAEKTDGDAGCSRDLRERKTSAASQTAEALAGRHAIFRGCGDYALFLEDVDNRGRIQSSGAPEKNRALQQAHIGFGIDAVAALRALRRDQAKRFPGAQSGRGNADAARHFADAQGAMEAARC